MFPRLFRYAFRKTKGSLPPMAKRPSKEHKTLNAYANASQRLPQRTGAVAPPTSATSARMRYGQRVKGPR